MADRPSTANRRYYEESDYFRRGGAHLTDPDSSFHRYRIRSVLTLCGRVAGLQVVDLGCGWGTISFALAEAGAARVTGIDFSSESVRLCRERLGREGGANLEFRRADARETGLPSGSIDLVVAADLIEHLPPRDTLEVYREARRILRPGGRLVIWAPAPGHILERLRRSGILKEDPTHVDYKTLPRVVAELSEEGFEVEEARHAESHLPGLRTLERVLMRWIPLLRRRIAVRAVRRTGGRVEKAGEGERTESLPADWDAG